MNSGQVEAPDAPPPAPSWAEAGTPSKSLRRRNLADRLARWVVSLGGVSTIAGVLGILLFIFMEVLPLLGGADSKPRPAIPLATSHRAIGAGVDEHETFGYVITASGWVEYFALQKDVAA